MIFPIILIIKREKREEAFGGSKSAGRTEFNLHQESHYNCGERNSTRKSFIVAATTERRTEEILPKSHSISR